jgi:hypothetical protein
LLLWNWELESQTNSLLQHSISNHQRVLRYCTLGLGSWLDFSIL